MTTLTTARPSRVTAAIAGGDGALPPQAGLVAVTVALWMPSPTGWE